MQAAQIHFIAWKTLSLTMLKPIRRRWNNIEQRGSKRSFAAQYR
jgi:hypothetical protein